MQNPAHSDLLLPLCREIENLQEAMTRDLETAVNIDSYSGYKEGVDRIGAFFAEKLDSCGLNIRIIKQSEYGNHIVADLDSVHKPKLLFYGHMDTVFPVGSARRFSINNDRAYGAGVIDMKSGILVLIYALQVLKSVAEIPVSIRVVLNSDEEPGSPTSIPLIPELIKDVDYACIMEPSEPDGSVITRRKGIGRFYVTVTGRAAHAGKQPETGINANLELAHQIIAAEQLADPLKGTTITTGLMMGGVSAYVVPENARAEIDVRVWNMEEQERITKGMMALQQNQNLQGSIINVQGGFHRPPLLELSGSEVLRETILWASRELQLSVKFGHSGAASDGNSLAGAGIPTIDGLGPVGGREHSQDEYMELSSYFARTKLLATFILGMAVSNQIER